MTEDMKHQSTLTAQGRLNVQLNGNDIDRGPFQAGCSVAAGSNNQSFPLVSQLLHKCCTLPQATGPNPGLNTADISAVNNSREELQGSDWPAEAEHGAGNGELVFQG